MITRLGKSLINLDEILYIVPQEANPNVADICFKSGKTISIAADDEALESIPAPGEMPPHRGPQGPKIESKAKK